MWYLNISKSTAPILINQSFLLCFKTINEKIILKTRWSCRVRLITNGAQWFDSRLFFLASINTNLLDLRKFCNRWIKKTRITTLSPLIIALPNTHDIPGAPSHRAVAVTSLHDADDRTRVPDWLAPGEHVRILESLILQKGPKIDYATWMREADAD